jgi:hypothetical protein
MRVCGVAPDRLSNSRVASGGEGARACGNAAFTGPSRSLGDADACNSIPSKAAA